MGDKETDHSQEVASYVFCPKAVQRCNMVIIPIGKSFFSQGRCRSSGTIMQSCCKYTPPALCAKKAKTGIRQSVKHLVTYLSSPNSSTSFSLSIPFFSCRLIVFCPMQTSIVMMVRIIKPSVQDQYARLPVDSGQFFVRNDFSNSSQSKN